MQTSCIRPTSIAWSGVPRLALPAAACRRLAAASAPAHLRQLHLRRLPAAAASSGGAAADPPSDPEPAPGTSTSPGDAASSGSSSSSEGSGGSPWRAVSLPMGLPTAGAVFVMAGFLKLVIMCFPWSEISIMMFVHGRHELGMMGALKCIPIALALAAGAKLIVDRGLQKRRWAQVVIVAGGALMLWASRLIFARPKPSPLDPMFESMRRERAAAIGEQRRVDAMQEQRQRQHLLAQPDPERAQQMMQEAEQQAAARGRAK